MGESDARSEVVAELARVVEDERLWERGDTLVVAVSGGADSLCLLGALLDLQERKHTRAPGGLVVATLDHGLRGERGASDARWVAALAASLGLRCFAGEVDALALARRSKRSLEDAARHLRYQFLRQVAQDAGASRICVAHTLDDQAETVLLRLLRGSGLSGLVAMRPLRGDIARPLLTVGRAQTEAYCHARGWKPRDDETNRDARYLRNRIRRDLLPSLESYNPLIRRALARTAAALADDETVLNAITEHTWMDVIEGEAPGVIALNLEAFADQPRALRRRLIRRAAEALKHLSASSDLDVIAQTLESRHVSLIERLAASGTTGATLTLPDSLRVTRTYTALRLTRAARETRESARDHRDHSESLTWELTAPGVVEAPELGWRVRAAIIEAPPGLEGAALPEAPDLPPVAHAGSAGAVHRGEFRVYTDANTTGDRLTVRGWRPGDRFRPLGMARAKKVQDVFTDAKIPRELRSRLPLVCVGEGAEERIVWIVGARIGDEFKLTGETRRALALQAEPLDRGEGEERA